MFYRWHTLCRSSSFFSPVRKTILFYLCFFRHFRPTNHTPVMFKTKRMFDCKIKNVHTNKIYKKKKKKASGQTEIKFAFFRREKNYSFTTILRVTYTMKYGYVFWQLDLATTAGYLKYLYNVTFRFFFHSQTFR